MEINLHHEDLLIKLRAKLNEDKIKLWEPPYYDENNEVTSQLQAQAQKYAAVLSTNEDTILEALRELQMHSLERSKANAEFKESGVATVRIRATMPGQKAKVINVQKKLCAVGGQLFAAVAAEIGVVESRIKLIFNGKVIKPGPTLEEQGIKNGSQIMALILTESPEEVKREDSMYLEMKSTKDDATLLSEYVDDLAEDDEYMKLEDQSGKAVEIPRRERRALLVGLALHERGRTALRDRRYSLALLLLLEADSQLAECSCSILQQVDNWAVLQLDVAWCYLCLQSLSSASDAAARLRKAEESFMKSYGDNMERLIALKGTAANERVLLMRLYLLQGIVAYHQNRREEARALLDRAEGELNALRVDEGGVTALLELGWSRSEARAGLRAAGGDLTRAHHYLEQRRDERDQQRRKHKEDREKRALGICMDGSPVSRELVSGLVGMGFERRTAVVALRNTNNHVAEAVRLIQEQPELLADSEASADDMESMSSQESLVEPDNDLVAELQAMGYEPDRARVALRHSRNHMSGAVDILTAPDPEHPSTSTGPARRKDKRKKERQKALERLTSGIRTKENDHLDTTLLQEEHFLAQYKSLL